MQAIILAAGKGTRLKPLTKSVPKALTEVNDVPIIINTLNILEKFNCREVIIVIGYLGDILVKKIGHYYGKMKITYVENTLYEKTNNVYSLYLTEKYVNDDLLLIECDLFYSESVIELIMDAEAGCNILVSDYNMSTMDGSVILVDKQDTIQGLVPKRNQGDGFDYSVAKKTVNIYKMKKEFMYNKFFPTLNAYIVSQSLNSYYELVIGGLIYWDSSDFALVHVDEMEWDEIDNIDDLQRAENKFKRVT